MRILKKESAAHGNNSHEHLSWVAAVAMVFLCRNWGSSYMEDTVHDNTLFTSESLAGVRNFIHGGGVQLSCARRGLRCVCR